VSWIKDNCIEFSHTLRPNCFLFIIPYYETRRQNQKREKQEKKTRQKKAPIAKPISVQILNKKAKKEQTLYFFFSWLYDCYYHSLFRYHVCMSRNTMNINQQEQNRRLSTRHYCR
jgi:hypothetical protein